jgi:hypothetical protein
MNCVAFWAVMLCNLIGGYQRFRRTYRLHLEEVSSASFVLPSYRRG